MKKLKRAAILVIGLLPLGVIAQPSQSPPPPSNLRVSGAPSFPGGPSMKAPAPEMPEKGKLSYAIGMFFGKNITNSVARGELSVDTNTLITAITDVLTGKPTRMTETELNDVMTQLKAAMAPRMQAEREAQRAKMEKESAESRAKGEAYLAQFGKSPGVTTLPDGLEYKVITDGSGPMPKENDTVTVNYRGTLIDGTEFDRHDGFTTPVKGRIIPGWQKILPLMKTGSKWQVAIPSALAYGPRGNPPKIPGNAVIIFDMELKSVTPGAPTLPPLRPASPASSATPASSTPVVSGEIIKVPSADELKKGAKIEVIKSGQTNALNSQ